MSKSGATASGAARGGATPASVLDFLYHDARRVGSFLAQFDPSGHLTGLKQSENVTDQAAEEADFQSGANALVFRATGKYVKKVATGASEGSERTYDPLWANARTFLDYLTEHDLLVRDVRDARLGQFVLAKGALILLDLTALKGAWGEAAMKKLVTQGLQQGAAQGVNREQRRAQGGAGKVDSDLFMALLKLLPHTVQARLIGDTAGSPERLPPQRPVQAGLGPRR